MLLAIATGLAVIEKSQSKITINTINTNRFPLPKSTGKIYFRGERRARDSPPYRGNPW